MFTFALCGRVQSRFLHERMRITFQGEPGPSFMIAFRTNRLLYDALIERATFCLYYDAKRMHERNKYFEIDALKDTWGKTNGTFS